MTREKILTIIGAVVVVAVLLTVALLLSGKDTEPEPTPTPVPTVSINPGPVPTAEPEDGNGGDPGHGEGKPPGEDVTPETEHGTVDDCETGPIGCEETDVIRNTAEDMAALSAVRPNVAPFVMEWARVQSTEDPAARTARLIAAGASPAVAAQVSELTRPKTTLSGLTTDATPQQPQRILSLGREDGLLKFQVSLDVDTKYGQADDSGSFRVIGGTIYVYLSDAGTVEKVVEKFPSIASMR